MVSRPKFFLPFLALLTSASFADQAALRDRWDKEIFPLLETYCYSCHGDGIRKGELDLDRFDSIDKMQADRDVWKRIRDHIRHRLMPPVDEDQPSHEEREKMLAWIDEAVFPVDPRRPDPGRVTLRRLNRVEYQNTLNDLLGTRTKIIDLIPPDDSGYGFDNIGDVLTLSPAHLERYLEAARVALDQAVFPGEMPRLRTLLRGGEIQGPGHRSDDSHFLFTAGETSNPFQPSRAGRYRITVTASGDYGADTPPHMELRLGGRTRHAWDVDTSRDRPKEFTHELRIDSDKPLSVGVAFTNDFWDENYPDPSRRDRNLRVHQILIEGPLDGPPPPKPHSHRRIFLDRKGAESDDAYSLRVLSAFARKAFRRPVHSGEIERYLGLVHLAREQKESVEHGIRLALEAMLVSPPFLFREEPQPSPDNPKTIHRIDEHTLATRLSYFFWSTMPDDRLRQLAERGQLRANLDGEIDRMIRSPRFNEFISHFTGQWLRLRDVPATGPAQRRFPDFDPSLRDAMRRETELFFSHILTENLPLDRVLDADFTFLNDKLARHYGIPGVEGRDFRKVTLQDSRRRGILGQGSFHLLTSYPLRTSPVLRGKYVLENLLDTTPPPPPPNVPQLDPPNPRGEQRSLREQLEKHREDPSCASCHALMDPIGFGLENFDATGAWRDQEFGKPIDSSGELIDGRRFHGVEELRRILVTDHREDFYRTTGSRMLTYALGRGLDWYDKPALDEIVRRTRKADGSSRALLKAVIESVPFQYRRGDT